MSVRKTTIIYNNTPSINKHQRIAKVSTKIVSIKHAPEGTNPATVEEFLKVAKQYWEFGVDIKQKRSTVYDVFPYRCLFSDPKQAEEARKEIEQTMIDHNYKLAMEEYKKSKWKEEAETWGDSDTEIDEEETKGEINENQF